MVDAFQAVIIGVLQGVLEWLPVSSEGNLMLIMISLLGLEAVETMKLAVVLHLGTGFAALIYYHKEIVDIFLGKGEEKRKLRLILAAVTFITGLVGLPIYLLLDFSVTQGETLMIVVGLALIITGLIQRGQKGRGNRNPHVLSWTEIFALGVFQGLSIIPGLSRSGVTITFLLVRGLNVGESFKLSFLMSIPASFAAGLGLMVLEGSVLSHVALVGVLFAALTGFIAIGSLVKLAERTSFWKICVSLGVLTLLASTQNLVSLFIR